MPRYLVTGAAGFIGSHLAERLLLEGHHVKALDNLSTGHIENLQAIRNRLEWIEGDAASPETAATAAQGVEGIFHLAAIPSVPLSIEKPLQNQRSGEVATLTLLEAARRAGVRRFVYTSSSAIYGNTGANSNAEDLRPRPLNPYALSKLTGEHYCRIYSQLHAGLDTACLRYFNVFGPRQDPSSPYSGVISIFIRCLQNRETPTIFGDGQQSRDFVEVSNVVAANLHAMNAPQTLNGEPFNVGTGESVTILEVWNFLQKLAGRETPPRFAPERAGDIKHSCASIRKIQDQLGYEPRCRWQEGLQGLWESVSHPPQPAAKRP